MMRWLRWGVLVSLILGLGVASRAAPGAVEPVENGFPLTPLPGADGPAETVNEDGKPAVRSVKDDKGNYPPYLYFRVPDEARRRGGPLYLQVDYKDVGHGPIGVQ